MKEEMKTIMENAFITVLRIKLHAFSDQICGDKCANTQKQKRVLKVGKGSGHRWAPIKDNFKYNKNICF
jgi:hypothetical protein